MEFKLSERMARLFHQRTGEVLRCCWLTCPAYSICDLRQWGQQIGDRDLSESWLVEMAPVIAEGRGPFNERERHFLEEMLERFESNDQFVPSQRAEHWLESLHDRWLERR